MREDLRILGIDPGLGIVGFGMVNVSARGSFGACEWGVITTSKDKPDGDRLQEIESDLVGVIDALKPDVVSLERLFFFKNAKTLVPVSQARGVIMLVCARMGLMPAEYTPMQVKQAMTGYGKSTKREIQEMTAQLLNLDDIPRPDDAADALALAVCHYNFTRGLTSASNPVGQVLSINR